MNAATAAPLSPDSRPDTIAWAEGAESVTRNGRPTAPLRCEGALRSGDIVFVSRAPARRPLGNALACAPARFVAMPSIAYRLARLRRAMAWPPCL